MRFPAYRLGCIVREDGRRCLVCLVGFPGALEVSRPDRPDGITRLIDEIGGAVDG